MFNSLRTATNITHVRPYGVSATDICSRLQGKVAVITASTDGFFTSAVGIVSGSSQVIRHGNHIGPQKIRTGKFVQNCRHVGVLHAVKGDRAYADAINSLVPLIEEYFLTLILNLKSVNKCDIKINSIGYAIAQRLGKEGASIVISSRKVENVNKAVTSLKKEGITVEGVVCHVGNADHRTKLFETAQSKFGGLDILVSNAAVNPAVSPILETDENVWDKIFEINVKNSWLLAKEAYPLLEKRGGGNIVFISSIAGYQAMEPLGPYSVSKTALLGLTKAIANEVVHENIRVNAVAPGIVATKFASAITSSEAGSEKSLSIVPMKRFGKPSEIAGAVAFLVSEDASYITGETIVAAGGAFAHL